MPGRARENGDLVVAREGVADFRLTITGRAAHAGIEPERGANAFGAPGSTSGRQMERVRVS